MSRPTRWGSNTQAPSHDQGEFDTSGYRRPSLIKGRMRARSRRTEAWLLPFLARCPTVGQLTDCAPRSTATAGWLDTTGGPAPRCRTPDPPLRVGAPRQAALVQVASRVQVASGPFLGVDSMPFVPPPCPAITSVEEAVTDRSSIFPSRHQLTVVTGDRIVPRFSGGGVREWISITLSPHRGDG